jgi:monofunctional biosynthetic peptidoglycan transglycosylase
VFLYLWRGLTGTAAIAFSLVAYAYLTLPDVRPLVSSNPSTTAFMELRASEAQRKGKDPRRLAYWAGYRQIAPSLTRAVLVAEDSAFWNHEGLDFQQIRESIKVDWARRSLVRGASTITQQLAKNLYLSPSRNPMRKFREVVITRRLEATLTKQRILELYLNLIEWGDGIYGAEAAARTYFSTSAAALGQSQAALLAGAIVNPRLLNPGRPTKRLLSRQQIILKRMGGAHPATPAEEMPTVKPAPPLPPLDDESDVSVEEVTPDPQQEPTPDRNTPL